MSNQIQQLTCENCGLIIIPKPHASDEKLLSIFEKHLLDFHAAEEFEFNVKEVD